MRPMVGFIIDEGSTPLLPSPRMASPDLVVPVKRHSHPFLIVLSLVAVALSSVALVKSCPPVPAPAAAPAVIEEKPAAVVVPVADAPAAVAPVPAPVEAPTAAPAPAVTL